MTAAPVRPSTELSWPTKPALSAPTTGTSGCSDSTNASTTTLSMPDVQTPSNGMPVAMTSRICCLPWSCCQPVNDFVHDLDVGILCERAIEALSRSLVGRGAGRAAHIDDVALAAELLEQPFGAEVGVVLLVVRDHVGRRLGHRLVNRDHDDAGIGRLLDRGVDARWDRPD